MPSSLAILISFMAARTFFEEPGLALGESSCFGDVDREQARLGAGSGSGRGRPGRVRLPTAARPNARGVFVVRGGVLLPVDPDGLAAALLPGLRGGWSGVLLDLAGGPRRSVPGCPLLRGAGGGIPALGRGLPVGRTGRAGLGRLDGWLGLPRLRHDLAGLGRPGPPGGLAEDLTVVPVDRRRLEPGRRGEERRPARLRS